MNIAVILAGGSGARMGLDLPKQFLKVAGKTILEHTIAAFQQHAEIDEIAVVANGAYIHLVEDLLLKNDWSKVKKLLNGGKERYDSSLSAIRAFEQEDNPNLIFHDAVRPLVSRRIISDNIAALNHYNAVDTAIPSTDTIIRLEESLKAIDYIPTRKYLWKGQTPQSFKLNTIKKAYDLALQDPEFKATDDCGVVKKYLPEEEIFVAKGEEQNIKLTYKEDIYLLDKLFQLKTSSVKRNPDLSGLKDKVIVVFGGSKGIGEAIVNIGKEIGAKMYPFSRSMNGVDVRKAETLERALKRVNDQEGVIDVVINTAGLLIKEPLNSTPSGKIDEIIEINLKGSIQVARAAYPYLKASQGHLLFYTSSSYTRGRAFYSLYSATKAANVNFVQAIAAEWDGEGIHVNCINPERTKTPMRISNFGAEPEDSLLKAEEVAKVSLGVVCSSLNGQVVDVKVKAIE